MGFLLAFRNRLITVPAVLMLEALWLDRTELFYWLLATGVVFFFVCWGFFFAYSGEFCSLLASAASPSPLTAVATAVADLGFALCHLALIIPYQCRRCCTELPGSPTKRTACPWSDIKKIRSSQFFFSSSSTISLLFLSAAAAAGRGCVTFVNCWNL